MEKMRDKIIIHNHTDLSDYDVLLYIAAVVNQGKISKNGDDEEQYSFAVMFKEGIVVSSGRKNNTYTFTIERR